MRELKTTITCDICEATENFEGDVRPEYNKVTLNATFISKQFDVCHDCFPKKAKTTMQVLWGKIFPKEHKP